MKERDREVGDRPVFVYGTLRRGQKNYPSYLAGRTLAEYRASTEGRLFFLEEAAEGLYPYLCPGNGRVVGELMVIDPGRYAATLERLDRLEDYLPGDEGTSLYLRRAAPVRLDDGTVRTAWIYYWNGPQVGTPIPGGDFVTWLRRRSRAL